MESGIVVPDKVVTRPTGKSAAPTTSAETATTSVAARQKTSTEAYLASSSRVRPAGATSR